MNLRIVSILLSALFLTPIFGISTESSNSEQKCGIWKVKVGDLDFYCLEEHTREIDEKNFENIDQEVLDRLALERNAKGSNIAFLIVSGEKVVLIDSGSRGKVLKHLEAMKISPSDVDAVLLTHSHLFAIAGLIRGDTPVFPNATLHLSEKEAEIFKQKWGGKGFYEKCQKVYGGIKTFSPEKPISTIPNEITAVMLPGHTPGHSGFMIVSGNDRLAVVGDLIFAEAVQFARPDINTKYDEDKELAAETRRKFLRLAVEQNWTIAASRLPFPGVGKVEADGDGFRFVPLASSADEAVAPPPTTPNRVP